MQSEQAYREGQAHGQNYGQVPPPGVPPYPVGAPAVPGGPTEDMGPADARLMPAPRQPQHMRQFSREHMHVRPQSPHGPFVPAPSEHLQNAMPHPDERLQHRRGMMVPSAAEMPERPHLAQENYRPREHEHPPMDRVPFESRQLAEQQQQQMRPMHNVSPGHPPYQDIPPTEQRHPQHPQHPQHHRQPSGVIMHEGNVPSSYEDHRERLSTTYSVPEYPSLQVSSTLHRMRDHNSIRNSNIMTDLSLAILDLAKGLQVRWILTLDAL
ncbi:hypothetical protein BGX34_005718 [Mortierella sp. NVP85]|nr:hypothetical protein BGX34_005718 [Mortierella sp. NVP85]